MLVKIGNKVYDSNKEPIMIVLSKQAKDNIANMLPDRMRYCEYPSKGYTENDIRAFMGLEKKSQEGEINEN